MRSTSLAGRGLLLLLAGLVLATARTADSPKDCFIGGQNGAVPRIETRSAGDAIGGAGYRFTVTNGVARVPVVVVGGSPYQMGWHLGRLMRPEIERFVPAALAGFKQKLGVNEEGLDGVWA
ncbi:MAG: hypothetical protein ACYDC1_05455, partial [Limisphaerales bacterium]